MKELRRFSGQNYERLRKNCLKKKQLFVDTVFPPTNQSLFLEQGRSSDIVWKRPAELHQDPHLFVEGASANDVTQGTLGNCWFVSACSALTHNQKLLNRVIPDSEAQEWNEKYAGIFRFRFWRFGQWVEVVIDDLLPTRDGKLLFARSKTPNEFWSALLEKAFAKLYGCYENLVGGQLSDALQDVSGGVAETIHVKKFLKGDESDSEGRLFENLQTAFNLGALVVAAIAAKTKDEIEQSLDCGLVKGHAYAVSAVLDIDLDASSSSHLRNLILGNKKKQKLIRLHNPWGEKEWNGDWSDNSAQWQNVSEEKKKEMGVSVEEDGEFWMPWDSFVYYFTDISLCELFNTSCFSLSKRYLETIVYGEWTTNGRKSGAPGDRAGGCHNFKAFFCNNPQYTFEVATPSDVMLALTQKEPNEGEKRRDPFVTIGLHIMKIENNRKHRVHQPMQAVAISEYMNARSVFLHLRTLPIGRYMLLPTTFAPREQAEFLMRIYSEQKIHLKRIEKDAPNVGFLGCRAAQSVTRIDVNSAHLTVPNELCYYVILKYKKKKLRTRSTEDTKSPKWDEQFVFHQSSQKETYELELWADRRLAKDTKIGFGFVEVNIDNDNRSIEVTLMDASDNSKTIGAVCLTISAYDDPMYL